MRSLSLSTLFLFPFLIPVPKARGELVTVTYKAEASTLVGRPFGIEVPRLTIVRGFFTYESDTPDSRPEDARRGSFEPVVGWQFRADFLDHTIKGTNRATGSTETFGHTLRFNDGGDSDETGEMTFDGAPRADIALGFSIVGGPEDLPSDQLPAEFMFSGAPHTFSLGDDNGRMLLQFIEFSQTFPFAIKSITRGGDEVQITWCSEQGRGYAVDFTTDIADWQVIRALVNAEGSETSIVDDLAERFGPGEDPPPDGFYRVRDLGPIR